MDSDAIAGESRPGTDRWVLPMLQLLFSGLQRNFHLSGLLQ